MVYSSRRFVLILAMYYFVLAFFRSVSIAITSFGEERANLSAFRTFCSICACLVLSVSSSSWCLGRAVSCNCGTPWIFLLSCFHMELVLTLFFPQLSFFWCLGRAVCRDYGIS